MKAALLAVCTTLTLLAGPALAQPLPHARPEQVGLSSERLAQVGRAGRRPFGIGLKLHQARRQGRTDRIDFVDRLEARQPDD